MDIPSLVDGLVMLSSLDTPIAMLTPQVVAGRCRLWRESLTTEALHIGPIQEGGGPETECGGRKCYQNHYRRSNCRRRPRWS